jgi:hypothetical protein
LVDELGVLVGLDLYLNEFGCENVLEKGVAGMTE